MRDKREICGTCKWHKYDKKDDDWLCLCSESDNIFVFTGYEDSCEDWEERE